MLVFLYRFTGVINNLECFLLLYELHLGKTTVVENDGQQFLLQVHKVNDNIQDKKARFK